MATITFLEQARKVKEARAALDEAQEKYDTECRHLNALNEAEALARSKERHPAHTE